MWTPHKPRWETRVFQGYRDRKVIKKRNVLDRTFMPLSGEIEMGGPSDFEESWLHGHR